MQFFIRIIHSIKSNVLRFQSSTVVVESKVDLRSFWDKSVVGSVGGIASRG